MRNIERLSRWTSLIAILSIVLLALSCSPLPSGSNVTSTTNSEEVATSQPIPSETQASPASTDLSLLVSSDPAKVDNSNLPITPIEELHVTGVAPDINIENYYLTIDGLVDTPLKLTYKEIMQYPTVTEVVLLICPGVFVDNAQWTGVPIATILAEAGAQPQTSEVSFHAADGYQVTLSLEEVQRDGVFLAYTVDGQTLPKEHGYPLRLVVKGEYGNNWIKWVNQIEIK